MRSAVVAPTGIERLLAADELIVTKTDPKGIITYANDVFCRMAAMTEEELIGRPHNVVRHPDMPRCIFKLLWETISAGEEIFAYVVNLAADGTHYWVLAHVTPTLDVADQIVGYHSNRRRPDRRAVDTISAMYRTLRAEERRHVRPAEALEASSQMLDDLLRQRGLAYDQFIWSMTPCP